MICIFGGIRYLMNKKIQWEKDDHGGWTMKYKDNVVRYLTPTQKQGIIDLLYDLDFHKFDFLIENLKDNESNS